MRVEGNIIAILCEDAKAERLQSGVSPASVGAEGDNLRVVVLFQLGDRPSMRGRFSFHRTKATKNPRLWRNQNKSVVIVVRDKIDI
ncbi:MAG: hypothetical protein DME46_04850 [Verrucomicrobia bacterium]|nr:MAG: hypothetical protein DME46_04850 [Verrucomicrobiota bacterium]